MARPAPRTTALLLGGALVAVVPVLLAVASPLAQPAGVALLAVGVVAGFAAGHARTRARSSLAREPDARLLERLRDGDRDLEALLELSPVGVCVSLDPAARSVRVNPAMARLLGLADGAAGTFRLLRDGVPIPDDELPMQRCAATGQAVDDAEIEIERADGSVRSLLASVRPLRGDDGAPCGFLGTCTDVTGRKRLERTLRHRSDSLEREDRNKDAFLATLAHELRNPLGAIANAVEILDDETAHPPGSPGARALAILQRQVAQAARLADDLLDLGRIRHGKFAITMRPIRLDGVMERAVEAARGALEEAGLALRWRAAQPVWVRGDEARLAQVFANLLGNACRHTPRGGCVTVDLAAVAGEAIVSVCDTGTGMPAEAASRVFEPFRQGAARGERGQLGLGLAIAKTIVEHHGGTIEAHSDGPGHGTQVRVRLPVAERVVRSRGPAGGGARGDARG